MDKTKTIEQLVDIILKDNKYDVLKETEKKVDDILEATTEPGLGKKKKETEEEIEECRKIREEIIGNLRENSEYQKFFVKMLAKWNVKGPAQLPPEKRKAFFNAVSKGWAAQKSKK